MLTFVFAGQPVKRLFKKSTLDIDNAFEEFICNELFDNKHFEISPLDSRLTRHDGEVNLSSVPLIDFKAKNSGKQFYVHIAPFIKGELEIEFKWCNADQFEALKNINSTLFVTIGQDTNAIKPKTIYCIPIQAFDAPIVSKAKILNFRIHGINDILKML